LSRFWAAFACRLRLVRLHPHFSEAGEKRDSRFPVAVTFMTVTPVIKPPLVIYRPLRFQRKYGRCGVPRCFGIMAAVIIGLVFAAFPPKGSVLSGGALDRLCAAAAVTEDAGSVNHRSKKRPAFFSGIPRRNFSASANMS
jgi:uncharacterized membrane protein YraQ (UPF0718 family)